MLPQTAIVRLNVSQTNISEDGKKKQREGERNGGDIDMGRRGVEKDRDERNQNALQSYKLSKTYQIHQKQIL